MDLLNNNSLIVLAAVGGVAVILLILVIVLFVMLSKQNKRLQKLEGRMARFMRGSQAKSLEDSIAEMFQEQETLLKRQDANRKDIQNIYDRMRSMIQKVGVVKYDAFSQMGGNLSSAIAILDENDNGFIMNTVQSVDGCYSYVKEVKNGRPDMDIGREEEEAMEKAMGSMPVSSYSRKEESGRNEERNRKRPQEGAETRTMPSQRSAAPAGGRRPSPNS